MPLETVSYINDLVITNPDGADQRSTADDHLRNIKKSLKLTFPNIAGEVSVSSAEINRLDGISANIETRLDAHLASIGAINTTISGMTTTLAAHGASISAINTTISGMTTMLNNISASMSNKLTMSPSGWIEYLAVARCVVTDGAHSMSWIVQPANPSGTLWSLSGTNSGVNMHYSFVHGIGINSLSFIPLPIGSGAAWLEAVHGGTGGTASYYTSTSLRHSTNSSSTIIVMCRFIYNP